MFHKNQRYAIVVSVVVKLHIFEPRVSFLEKAAVSQELLASIHTVLVYVSRNLACLVSFLWTSDLLLSYLCKHNSPVEQRAVFLRVHTILYLSAYSKFY